MARPPKRPRPFSSRSRDLPPSATGRKVSGRGGQKGWSGSSHWSPYESEQDRLWPKLLIVGVILTVVIGGSILVASALGGEGDDGDTPAVAAGDATATPTEPSTSEATEEGAVGAEQTAPAPVDGPTPTAEPSPSPTPHDEAAIDTPKEVAEAYAETWSSLAYDQMYEMLSSESKSQINKEDFIARYEAIAIEAGIIELKASITGGRADDLIFPIQVEINSSRIGEFTDDNQIPIIRDGEQFKVDWTPSLIFSGLGDGLVRWTPDVPQRGRILDRKGRPLAETGFISRVGVIPGQIQNEGELLNQLSTLLEMPADKIKAKYEGGEPTWFMPVKDYPDVMDAQLVAKLGEIPGVTIQKWPARTYALGPSAAHITGYLSEITAEELPELAKQGYVAGDMIGRGGIEASAEKWLAGKRGGTLAIIAPDGSTRRILGEVEAVPAKDVVLTIDLDLQLSLFDSIGDQVGSAVAIDPQTGQVLAMASRPSFDPNKFVTGMSDEEWQKINDPETTPMINRATQRTYPTGSVFKLVTASAGIKYLGMTADTWFNCPGAWSLPEAPDQVWHDWIPGGQGEMNLHRAIYRSCNTVFYQIGAQLDKKDETLLPTMAKAFGFGKPTGLDALSEASGTVPSPEWKMETLGEYWSRGDAVNFAIGQGYFSATPLQVANAYVAITNGGTLYEPYLIMDVVDLNGDIVYSGEPTEAGKLPLTPDQIKILTDGMYDVVHASDGTSREAFVGAPYDVSGKTGTAQVTEGVTDHAWFASFAPSGDPQVTVVTMVEHGVAGSEAAAPVARRFYDDYFTLYPPG